MRIVVNAISISEGGGVVVLTQLLKSANKMDPNINWHVIADPQLLSLLPKTKNINGLSFPWAKKSFLHQIYWYEIILPKLIKQLKADIFFSQTNFLPSRQLYCPSLLLIQHAGYFSKTFKNLHFQFYKNRIQQFIWKQKKRKICKSIKIASRVTVQTHALANEIASELSSVNEKIIVVPHGPGIFNDKKENTNQPEHNVRIGYITKFGVQKNFLTVFKAIHQLKNHNIQFKFILTINPHTKEAKSIFNIIHQYELDDVIENHGGLTDPLLLKNLYDSLHIFIFPSLCESFGFTLVEAMASGLPVIVADTPSNKEIANDAGIFFPPTDDSILFKKIAQLIEKPEAYRLACENSFSRAKDFCWDECSKKMIHLMKELANKKDV